MKIGTRIQNVQSGSYATLLAVYDNGHITIEWECIPGSRAYIRPECAVYWKAVK